MYNCKKCNFSTESVSEIANHYKSIHPTKNDIFVCEKCDKIFKNKCGFSQHIKFCNGKKEEINHICPKCNFYIPNSIEKHKNSCDGTGPWSKTGKTSYVKNGKGFGWSKGLTKETSESLKKVSETLKNRNLNPENIYHHTEETKKILSEKLNKRYEDGWDPKAGRCKKISYISSTAGEILVDGNWELQTAKYLDSIEVKWERNKKKFKYFNSIKNYDSNYTPDFYVYDWDVYIEVKGYTTELDKIKWNQFTEKLEIWDRKKLEELGLDIKYKKS